MTTIDLVQLLHPINATAPGGEDLSFDTVFDEIKEARRADADYLNQGDWQTSLKMANWPRVKQLASESLANRSKDMQLAAWLGESLVQLHGFAGASDAFALMQGLLEQFWETLFPELEEDDLDQRIARLEWLDNNLAQVLRQTALTQPYGEFAKGFGLLRWQESRDVDNLARQSDEAARQALSEGKINSEIWSAAVNQTPSSFYAALLVDGQAAQQAFTALCGTIDARFGYDAPRLGQLQETLDGVVKLLGRLAAEKGVAGTVEDNAAPVTDLPPGTVAIATAATVPVQVVGGPPKTRAEALRQLNQVADFFRETEPHSPVAYLAEKAARWGNMRLDEWIREVINDDSTRRRLKDMLGYSEE